MSYTIETIKPPTALQAAQTLAMPAQALQAADAALQAAQTTLQAVEELQAAREAQVQTQAQEATFRDLVTGEPFTTRTRQSFVYATADATISTGNASTSKRKKEPELFDMNPYTNNTGIVPRGALFIPKIDSWAGRHTDSSGITQYGYMNKKQCYGHSGHYGTNAYDYVLESDPDADYAVVEAIALFERNKAEADAKASEAKVRKDVAVKVAEMRENVERMEELSKPKPTVAERILQWAGIGKNDL